jgi:hypothetical protein
VTDDHQRGPRQPNEEASNAIPPDYDPFIATAREQAQLTFRRGTAKAKKAVKSASDVLRLTSTDIVVARRYEVVEKQAWRLGLFVKRGALEWAHARDTLVKIAKTFPRQTDAERARWTYIVELVLTDAFIKGEFLSDEDAGLIEPVTPRGRCRGGTAGAQGRPAQSGGHRRTDARHSRPERSV